VAFELVLTWHEKVVGRLVQLICACLHDYMSR
jgi:hypothetical protein